MQKGSKTKPGYDQATCRQELQNRFVSHSIVLKLIIYLLEQVRLTQHA